MANLNRDDRGQIILVAAFAIAVIFVSLALIVNSAIFTENLASRGETTGSEGALSMRANVETNVGYSLEAVNEQTLISHVDLEDDLASRIENISNQTGNQEALSGRVVSVSGPTSRSDGVRIVEDQPGPNDDLTNSDGDDDYRVVGGVWRAAEGNGTRAFEINASDIRNAGGVGAGASDNSTAFGIMVQDSGATGNTDSWRAQIWETSTGEIHVRTLRNVGGSVSQEDCEVTPDSVDPNVYIDVTGGTIDGEPCPALQTGSSGENFHFGSGTGATPGDSTDNYDISFANSTNIEGNFSMTVHDSTLTSLDLSDLGTGTQITTDNALYDVTVDYTYTTSDLRYETEVRVAPGEPDV